MTRFALSGLLTISASLAWSQKAPNSFTHPTHGWWHSTFELRNLPLTPKIGVSGDFNNDGLEDVLVSDMHDVFVAWNSPHGLGPWEPNLLPPHGINRLIWDETDEVLWIEYISPGRIEARSWNGIEWRSNASFDGSPQSIRLSPGAGLVTLKRHGLELELLRSSGERELLIQNAAELSQAYYWEDSHREAKALVVQDNVSGRLGKATAARQGWSEVEWWEDTKLSFQWESHAAVAESGSAVIHVLGADHQSLWFKTFDAISGSGLSAWRSPQSVGEVRFHQPRFSQAGLVQVLTHNLMTYAVRVCELNAHTGELVGLTALEELDKVPFVLDVDLNGDGETEWMYPSEILPAWSIVSDWSRLTHRWAWRNQRSSNVRDWTEHGKLGQGWIDALKTIEDVSEVWMHRGKLHAKNTESWWTLEAQAPPETKASPNDWLDSTHSHQLVLSYLELGDRGTGAFEPGLAEIQPHRWYHVAFSRAEDNTTQVWVDGETAFLGKSKDLNYFYNSILVGGFFASHWTNHGAVSVDDVVLSGAFWTDEEVSWLHRRNQNLDPARYSERWEFEDLLFRSERRKREMVVLSQPKLDDGVSGKCVTFDGVDDALRTFLAVPKKGISLSFFFRFNEERPSRPHTIATLYGMFNTWFNVVWQPSKFLALPDANQGVITTPLSCSITPSPWPAKCSAFLIDETLMAIDTSNVIWMEGPLGWEPRLHPPKELGPRRGDVWSVNGNMCLLDRDNVLWQWGASEGWRKNGRARVNADDALVATAQGVLSVSDSTWSWWGDPTLPGRHSGSNEPNLVDVVHSPAGEFHHYSNGQTEWWNPVYPKTGKPINPMTKGPDLPLPWVWVGLLGMLSAFGAWKMRQSTSLEASSSTSLPKDLQAPLSEWMLLGGRPLDAQGLDAILSGSPFETEETRRGRRSRFVREMNAFGQAMEGLDFVQRGKDAHDRRRVVYRLHSHAAHWLDQGQEDFSQET